MSKAAINPKTGKKLLGQMLIEAGLIDEIQLTVALGAQRESGLKIGKQLLKLGFIEEADLARFLEGDTDIGVPLVKRKISNEALKAVPEKVAFKYMVFPVAVVGKTLLLATANPDDLKVNDELTFLLSKNIQPVKAFEWDIESALLKFYKGFSDDELSMLTNVSSSADAYNNATWAFDGEILLEDRQKTTPPKKEKAVPPAPAPQPNRAAQPQQRRTQPQRPSTKPAQPSRPAQGARQAAPTASAVPAASKQQKTPSARRDLLKQAAREAQADAQAAPSSIIPDTTSPEASTDDQWEFILEHTSLVDDEPVNTPKAKSSSLVDTLSNVNDPDILKVIINLLIEKNLLTDEELAKRLSEMNKNGKK